jgi:hypothetical protein
MPKQKVQMLLQRGIASISLFFLCWKLVDHMLPQLVNNHGIWKLEEAAVLLAVQKQLALLLHPIFQWNRQSPIEAMVIWHDQMIQWHSVQFIASPLFSHMDL